MIRKRMTAVWRKPLMARPRVARAVSAATANARKE